MCSSDLGAQYGWIPHDYKGTHGGHFIFNGEGQTSGGPIRMSASSEAGSAADQVERDQLTADRLVRAARRVGAGRNTTTVIREPDKITPVEVSRNPQSRDNVITEYFERFGFERPKPAVVAALV